MTEALTWLQAYSVDLALWAIIVGVAVLVADALGLLGGRSVRRLLILAAWNVWFRLRGEQAWPWARSLCSCDAEWRDEYHLYSSQCRCASWWDRAHHARPCVLA